jgi:hypothetical protein
MTGGLDGPGMSFAVAPATELVPATTAGPSSLGTAFSVPVPASLDRGKTVVAQATGTLGPACSRVKAPLPLRDK